MRTIRGIRALRGLAVAAAIGIVGANSGLAFQPLTGSAGVSLGSATAPLTGALTGSASATDAAAAAPVVPNEVVIVDTETIDFSTIDPLIPAAGGVLNTLAGDAGDVTGKPVPVGGNQSCNTQPDMSGTNKGTVPGHQIGIVLKATNWCDNPLAHVKISSFFIHSSAWGDSAGPTGCSGDGSCTATVHWFSRGLACGEEGIMTLPFSMNFINPQVGNSFVEGQDRIVYRVICPNGEG